jgi:hypothetical protein
MDPSPDLSRDGYWHLRSILIFCRVHFARTVARLCPETTEEGQPWKKKRSQMMGLLDCASLEDYHAHLQLLVREYKNYLLNTY